MLAKLKYNAALFMIAAADRKENGPLMSGSINLPEDKKLPFSAFAKLSKEGKNYFSLSVGGADSEHQYGALFPATEKKTDKSPDYTGSIDLVKGGDERLRVVGWKRAAAGTGKTYISLALSPISATGEYKDESPADSETATPTTEAPAATV